MMLARRTERMPEIGLLLHRMRVSEDATQRMHELVASFGADSLSVHLYDQQGELRVAWMRHSIMCLEEQQLRQRLHEVRGHHCVHMVPGAFLPHPNHYVEGLIRGSHAPMRLM